MVGGSKLSHFKRKSSQNSLWDMMDQILYPVRVVVKKNILIHKT